MVHDALMEAFTVDDTSIPVNNFHYAKQSKKSQINTRIRTEYQVINYEQLT
jgi:hypothetical protein